MKLKYYMRGLGVGIVITTLILTIANPNHKLTDEEIKQRARALGMVMEDENNADLKKILDNITPTEAADAPTSTPEPEATMTPTAAPTPTPTPFPTMEPTIMPTAKPTILPKPETDSKDTPKATDKMVNFTIQKGMSSGDVAAILVKVGLIKNADDFNKYIVKEGKASIIRVGNYSLPEDATYDEIIKKITTRQN